MNRVAIHNFWRGIQWALNYVPAVGVADRPEMTDELIDKLLAGNRTWLTAKLANTAEFFSEYESSYQFLPKAEFESLAEAVKGLWDVAVELRPHELPRDDQRSRALPHFKAIIKLLGFGRYADPDAFILGKTLERKLTPTWPHHLDHMRFQTGLDSTGDPALWVWVFVKEAGEHDEQAFFAAVDEIGPPLDEAAREVAQDRWPYISYRSTLDQQEVEAAA